MEWPWQKEKTLHSGVSVAVAEAQDAIANLKSTIETMDVEPAEAETPSTPSMVMVTFKPTCNLAPMTLEIVDGGYHMHEDAGFMEFEHPNGTSTYIAMDAVLMTVGAPDPPKK
jgi:hypothetical protein